MKRSSACLYLGGQVICAVLLARRLMFPSRVRVPVLTCCGVAAMLRSSMQFGLLWQHAPSANLREPLRIIPGRCGLLRNAATPFVPHRSAHCYPNLREACRVVLTLTKSPSPPPPPPTLAPPPVCLAIHEQMRQDVKLYVGVGQLGDDRAPSGPAASAPRHSECSARAASQRYRTSPRCAQIGRPLAKTRVGARSCASSHRLEETRTCVKNSM